jgi:hypothetical protein
MQNTDKKIYLIMRLNSYLKRLELYLNENQNAPKFMHKELTKATLKYNILKNVLINMNYLNY